MMCQMDGEFPENGVSKRTGVSRIEELDWTADLNLPPDTMAFIRSCENGLIYEEMMTAVGSQDRGKFKENYFGYLFGKENHCRDRILRNAYPNVAKAVTKYKESDYKALSHALQRMESTIMIQGVAFRLCEEGRFVLTIHDCVAVLEEDVNRTIEIIDDEFSKHFVMPTLKVKKYSRMQNGVPE